MTSRLWLYYLSVPECSKTEVELEVPKWKTFWPSSNFSSSRAEERAEGLLWKEGWVDLRLATCFVSFTGSPTSSPNHSKYTLRFQRHVFPRIFHNSNGPTNVFMLLEASRMVGFAERAPIKQDMFCMEGPACQKMPSSKPS